MPGSGPQLFPNPAVSILPRRGQLVAAHLAGITPAMELAAADLCILAAFMGGATVPAAAQRLRAGSLAQLVAGPPGAGQFNDRVRQLCTSQLLVESPASHTSLPSTDLADLDAGSGIDLNSRLRLPNNFSLQAVPEGFRSWCAPQRRPLVLGPGLALLACAFSNGRHVDEIIRSHRHLGEPARLSGAVGWLLEHGLLTQVVAGAPAAAAAPGAQRLMPEPAGPGWAGLQADGRIPVYFAPHMENHYPLALGMLFSAIANWQDGALLERFQLIPITFLEPQQLFDGPYRKFGAGVWLFSNYMWSVDINLKLSQGFKSHNSGNLCIHGGPSTPGYKDACAQFMARNPSVDVAVHGEGEVTIAELLSCVQRDAGGGVGFDQQQLRAVHGLTFRSAPGELGWTPPRTRMREPDEVPSPYLQGVFDHYRGRVDAAIIESNRGCPFGCTFCDWGSATSQKVRKFDLDRVRQEVEWIGRRGIRVLWIADANFGMYDRDIELAEHIVATKAKFGYPSEVVVNYTKNTNRRLIEIIRVFSTGGIISQGIISIQTTDDSTLEVINRRNIKTEKYDELAQVFEEARLPLSTDLMIGLPGITVEAWDRDLQRYFDADVSVKAYPTQLLPNSPMADPEYRQKYRIETDSKDFVVACHSFDRQQLQAMKDIYHAYEVAESYGLLRYVMRYLQWEHAVPALHFLHGLLETLRAAPASYPSLSWAFRLFSTEKTVPGGWQRFYREVAAFIEARHGIGDSSTLQAALLVNEAAMPDDTLHYPRAIALPHDFVSWFHARRRTPGALVALADYPPARFEVDDPDLMAHIDMDYWQYDSHQYFWELRSAVARPKSVADVQQRVAERQRQSA